MAGLGMITAWVITACALLTILGVCLRIAFQVGGLVSQFRDHISDHGELEQRITRLEVPTGRSRR